DFGMQRNRNRLSLGIVGMTESNVATLLAHGLITKFAEGPDQYLRPKQQASSASSRYDDAANQDIFQIRKGFAAAFHVFQAKVDCFADVGEGLGNGFPLRVAAWQRGADHRIAAVVLIWFQEDFEVVGSHLSHRSEAPGGMQGAAGEG